MHTDIPISLTTTLPTGWKVEDYAQEYKPPSYGDAKMWQQEYSVMFRIAGTKYYQYDYVAFKTINPQTGRMQILKGVIHGEAGVRGMALTLNGPFTLTNKTNHPLVQIVTRYPVRLRGHTYEVESKNIIGYADKKKHNVFDGADKLSAEIIRTWINEGPTLSTTYGGSSYGS